MLASLRDTANPSTTSPSATTPRGARSARGDVAEGERDEPRAESDGDPATRFEHDIALDAKTEGSGDEAFGRRQDHSSALARDPGVERAPKQFEGCEGGERHAETRENEARVDAQRAARGRIGADGPHLVRHHDQRENRGRDEAIRARESESGGGRRGLGDPARTMPTFRGPRRRADASTIGSSDAILLRMSGIHHDESSLPLVVVTWSGEASDAEFEAFFAAQRRLLARRRPYVQVADASAAKVMSSLQRRLMAQFSEETAAEAARYCKGTAVVIKNALVRGALTAVLWLVKVQYPLVVVGTFEEAMVAVERWSMDAGLTIPQIARRARA
jgi:hypothetical protein